MTDALFIYLKGEEALAELPAQLAERARHQWERLKGQTALMQKELQFCQAHRVQTLCYTDADYPQRLRQCADAPLVLFYLGSAPLNARHIVSIVGTRKISNYGKDMCRLICEDLVRHLPDVLIVSGLAYGVDIHSHRGTLAAGGSTVGVVAHGLDRIYPYVHKDTAAQMTRQGGLLTEYPTGTEPERYNFVHRNRIVAGIADCTIVVESAARGGSMITAGRAREYGRRVFACPGRLTDATSEGCNRLIAAGEAEAYIDAETLIKRMGWESGPVQDATQQSLFASSLDVQSLSPSSQRIVATLRNTEGLTIDQLSSATGLAAREVAAELMDLEMDGIVELCSGACYRLLAGVI